MDGRNLIGFNYSAKSDAIMEAINPGTKERLDGHFNIASTEEIDQALNLANSAFQQYKNSSGKKRATFLNAIADEIMELGDHLVERAMKESGLPKGRIVGERGRTVNQLRLFAQVAEESHWVEASIDLPVPDRQPSPKADIRKMLVPIGPVVVFTASNFPLAFSTAGGDTASALAAGCPVIVKAHESHLGTNALVAMAIQNAAHKTGMPDGVFSSLNGTGPGLGQALAAHPLVKSIAFTGSFKGGKALFDTAAQRAVPIPVFAEMGSINPVLVLKDALEKRGDAIAKQYAGSVTLGVGQFCTNPGLLIVEESDVSQQFIKKLAQALSDIPPGTMLNEKVCQNYQNTQAKILQEKGVTLEGAVETVTENVGSAAVASVAASDFLGNPSLQEEVFGPFTLVVCCKNGLEMEAVVKNLEGQLTATIISEGNLKSYQPVISILQDKVGRIIYNGVPTGVEVCASMHHGGPFPATTDSRFTSVGTAAIKRFARPLAFQNWPKNLLPEPLQDENPLNIWRQIDGIFSKDVVNS